MARTRTNHRILASLMVAACAAPALVQGCSRPTAPVQPPGGGQTLTLSYPEFQHNVEPVLVKHGCDATGDCHGGGIRGTFQLSPPGAKDARFDFDQSSLQAWATNRDQSPLLLQPLAIDAGGTPHPFKPFASTSDSDFVAMRQGRDKTLSVPDLLLPAVQVNIRAGRLPVAESNGRSYLKLPLNAL